MCDIEQCSYTSTCMLVKIDLDTEMLDLSGTSSPWLDLKGPLLAFHTPSSGSPCPVFELLIIICIVIHSTCTYGHNI